MHAVQDTCYFVLTCSLGCHRSSIMPHAYITPSRNTIEACTALQLMYRHAQRMLQLASNAPFSPEMQRWGSCIQATCGSSAAPSLSPGRIMQQLNIHAVGRELQVAHHRSSDEAIPDRFLQQTPQGYRLKCINGDDAADYRNMSI